MGVCSRNSSSSQGNTARTKPRSVHDESARQRPKSSPPQRLGGSQRGAAASSPSSPSSLRPPQAPPASEATTNHQRRPTTHPSFDSNAPDSTPHRHVHQQPDADQ